MAQTLVCLRYLLIGGAVVVGVCGVIESVCAGYFIYKLYEYSPLTPSNVCGAAITLLVMGLITCIIAWWAWQFLDFTDRGQVIFFSTALIIVIIINTSAGIWALVRHEQVDLLPIEHLERVFELAISDDKPLWDRMHSKLHCCGINGPADYRSQDAVPWSCCDTSSGTNSSANSMCITMYAYGCQHVVINRTRSILLYIFLLALCTVLLQVCFVTCTFCYVKACHERMERRKEYTTAQSLARASKDFKADDDFPNEQTKHFKASSDV